MALEAECLREYTAGVNAARPTFRAPVVSAVLHGAAILALVLLAARAPRVKPVNMPGTANGKHLLLTYSLGGQASASSALPKKAAKPVQKAESAAKSAPLQQATSAPATEQGSGSSGLSALGGGNVTFAAMKVFPRPQPDLSSMPRGKGGNVVLNAVIDAHGAITDLTVLQSLGEAIDQQVIATVRNWTFTPATKDGQPITSEQEIVLHYDRT